MSQERQDLVADLRSSDWSVRAAAACALREVPGDAVTHALAEALDSDDTAVTQEALDSLVARGDPLAVDLIWRALNELDEDLAEHMWFFLLAGHPGHDVTLELQRRNAATSP